MSKIQLNKNISSETINWFCVIRTCGYLLCSISITMEKHLCMPGKGSGPKIDQRGTNQPPFFTVVG